MLEFIKNLLSTAAILWIHWIIGGNSEIVKEPVHTEVKVGEKAYLNCSISDPFGEISWFHHPVGKGPEHHNYVYLKGKLISPYDQRFLIEKKMSNEAFDFNLVVPKVEISDAGVYVCQNGNTESSVPAELIIIDSDPVCVTNVNSNGFFIGPNICGLNKDVVQLSCVVNYTGNIPPKLEWTIVQDKTFYPVPESQTTCKASNGRVICNYTAESDVYMDGSYFVCQTTRSRNVQYNCKTDNIKILYAIIERKKLAKKILGDVVTCSANTNLAFCNYKWIWSDGDSEETSSEYEALTITRTGWYQCEVNCPISQHQCRFEAMRILVNNALESSTNPTISAIIVALAALSGCCATVIVVAVVWCCKKHKTKITSKDVTDNEKQISNYNSDNRHLVENNTFSQSEED